MEKKRIKIFANGYSNFMFYVLILVAVVAIALLFKNRMANKAQDANLSSQIKTGGCQILMQPNKLAVAKNSDFLIDVAVDPASHKVSNLDLALTFDKAKMRLDSIEQTSDFPQILANKIEEGVAFFSAATNFGSNVYQVTKYATLHFHALQNIGNAMVTIDAKKSGVYADDDPGKNNLAKVEDANVTITN